MCAGFATSPVSGWRRTVASLVASAKFNRAMPESAIRWFLLGPSAPPDLVLRVRQAISSVRSDVLRSRLREILACDVRWELAQVTAPVLYIQARNDRLVRYSSLGTIKAIKPNTSVVVLDAPHLLLQAQPRKAAEAVKNFVRQHGVE
jgi:sigma-B regulation protein RsbQ